MDMVDMEYPLFQTNSLSRSSMTALARHTSGPKSPYYKAHNFVVSVNAVVYLLVLVDVHDQLSDSLW